MDSVSNKTVSRARSRVSNDTPAAAPDQPLDKRRKEARPTHITVGEEVFERNDITAKRYGGSERTINRGGGPYRFFSASNIGR